MSVKLIGSEPDDEVPESFSAYLDAGEARIVIWVPAYMEIPFIDDCQDEELFNTAAGCLSVKLKDLLEDYANDCIREDGGDGLLNMADFFEKSAKQLRAFHATLDPEEMAAAKAPFDLVVQEASNG